jgi:hypothetical protein
MLTPFILMLLSAAASAGAVFGVAVLSAKLGICEPFTLEVAGQRWSFHPWNFMQSRVNEILASRYTVARVFAAGLLTGLLGLLVCLAGLLLKNNDDSIFGAGLLALGCFVVTWSLMQGEKIETKGGDLGNELSPPSHTTF